MKKITYYLVLILTIITIGCSKKDTKLDSIRYELKYKQSSLEKVIIEQSNEGIVEIEEETNRKDCSKKEGCTYITYYDIKGKKEGNTKITFIRKRLSDGKVVNKRIYDITVDKDLKIKETHKDRSND